LSRAVTTRVATLSLSSFRALTIHILNAASVPIFSSPLSKYVFDCCVILWLTNFSFNWQMSGFYNNLVDYIAICIIVNRTHVRSLGTVTDVSSVVDSSEVDEQEAWDLLT
jgi:hypothetical protein